MYTFNSESADCVCISIIIKSLTHVFSSINSVSTGYEERMNAICRMEGDSRCISSDLHIVVPPEHIDRLCACPQHMRHAMLYILNSVYTYMYIIPHFDSLCVCDVYRGIRVRVVCLCMYCVYINV